MEVREKEGKGTRPIKRLAIGKRKERRRDFEEADGREVKGEGGHHSKKGERTEEKRKKRE